MAALPAAAQRGGAPSSGEDPSGMPSASSTARCQQPRRKTGDVVGHDWSKLVIRQADSDRMLEELQAGNCICEDMDDIPGDTYKHPLSRLHYEQLDRQRPRGPELAGPSEAPHLRLRTLRAETATSGEALDRCLRRNALAGDLGPLHPLCMARRFQCAPLQPRPID
ncbi:unnamed protein product [Prorocentrum cordatum]|uniref:Uncharacterized protein n=1 Tax=Prorocentrum cordatum TaxID=2364126 RepID=A0ABN9UCU0_9DINO|nr:unnamed protein product [Polarella glacialis]